MTAQMIIMYQCSQCCSSPILVTGGWKLSCRTAGPPGRSFTACAMLRAAVAPHATAAQASVFSCFETIFAAFTSSCLKLITQNIGPQGPTRAQTKPAHSHSNRAQCHPQFTSQRRAQLRAHIPADLNPSALSGNLNQRMIPGSRLHTHPFTVEFRAPQFACGFELHDQSRTRQQDPFAVRCMTRVHDKGQPYRQDFYPGKRQYQRRALVPEIHSDTQ